MVVLGFIISVAAVLLVSFLTILGYFGLDKLFKKNGAKDLSVFFIILVFLITLGIHFACIYPKIEADNLAGSIFNSIKAIYRQLGSLTFEGFDDKDIADNCVFLYLGSTLWLAVTNALLISANISYEFRCKLRFFFAKLWPYWCKSKRSIYIFSIISDDALTLAESIRRESHFDTRDELINGKVHPKSKPLIIFAGDEIGPFDKTNELHQKIRMCDYYFFSFAKKEKKNDKNNQYRKNHLLFRIFFLKMIGHRALFNIISKQDVHIFALAKDEHDKGLESKNSDIVFDDIKSLAPRLFEEFYKRLTKVEKEIKVPVLSKKSYQLLSKEEKKIYRDYIKTISKQYMKKYFPHIDYHVLVNNEINYEFFFRSLNELLDEVFEYFIKKGVIKNLQVDDDIAGRIKLIKPLFRLIFGIDAICEPVASAEDMILKRQDRLPFKLGGCLTKVNNKWEMNYSEDNVIKALVIGFGSNGQQALGHLYADCIGGKLESESNAFIPNKFHADVLDKEIDDVIAPFMSAHPLFAFKQGTLKDGPIPYYDKIIEIDPVTGKEVIKKVPNKEFERIKNFYNGHTAEDLDMFLSFPQVFYRQENFNSVDFINTIDDVVNYAYNYVVITLGDDERNISCANALLQTIRQRINAKKIEKKTLTIFINIRNKDNNNRINWDETEDEALFNNVNVRVFGNASDIYSSKLLKFKDAASIDTAYNEINRNNQYSQHADDRRLAYNQYFALSIYEKKTNAAACIFGKFYYLYLNNLPEKIKSNLTDDMREFDRYVKESLANDVVIKDEDGLTFTLVSKEIENKKYFIFKGKNAETIQQNILATLKYENDVEKDKRINLLPQSFASYFRFRSAYSIKYFEECGQYWYYLAQFDHNRWCRHMMMYGRSYTNFFVPAYESKDFVDAYKEKEENDNGIEKRWKNIYLLSDCVIPYSSFVHFDNKAASMPNYLQYHEEDYDYNIFLKSYKVNKAWYEKAIKK